MASQTKLNVTVLWVERRSETWRNPSRSMVLQVLEVPAERRARSAANCFAPGTLVLGDAWWLSYKQGQSHISVVFCTRWRVHSVVVRSFFVANVNLQLPLSNINGFFESILHILMLFSCYTLLARYQNKTDVCSINLLWKSRGQQLWREIEMKRRKENFRPFGHLAENFSIASSQLARVTNIRCADDAFPRSQTSTHGGRTSA